jgi:hypothetical protein
MKFADKRIITILSLVIFILFTAQCNSIDSSIYTSKNQHKAEKGCRDVRGSERLICQSQMLQDFETILNSDGELVSTKVLEQDAYCSRIEQIWVYGSNLKPEWQMQRQHTFTVCSGTFWGRLKREAGLVFVSVVIGIVTGVYIAP